MHDLPRLVDRAGARLHVELERADDRLDPRIELVEEPRARGRVVRYLAVVEERRPLEVPAAVQIVPGIRGSGARVGEVDPLLRLSRVDGHVHLGRLGRRPGVVDRYERLRTLSTLLTSVPLAFSSRVQSLGLTCESKLKCLYSKGAWPSSRWVLKSNCSGTVLLRSETSSTCPEACSWTSMCELTRSSKLRQLSTSWEMVLFSPPNPMSWRKRSIWSRRVTWE